MIKFLTTNIFDTATITSLNAATGYAAANVQNRFLKKTYRSTGLSNQWLKFDMASAKNVTLFTLFNNNLTSAATVKIYGHASDLGNTEAAWAGATYSTTITSFNERVAYLALNQTFRWWLITFTDAANPDSFIEVGRVFGGVSVSPDENFNENISEEMNDPSDQEWTVGQHVYSTQRERFTNFNFSFTDIKAANQTILRTLWASVYKTEPFVIAFDGDSQPLNWTRIGVFTSEMMFSYTANARANCYLSFRELR